jgi:hypothetical protein
MDPLALLSGLFRFGSLGFLLCVRFLLLFVSAFFWLRHIEFVYEHNGSIDVFRRVEMDRRAAAGYGGAPSVNSFDEIWASGVEEHKRYGRRHEQSEVIVPVSDDTPIEIVTNLVQIAFAVTLDGYVVG